MSLFLHTIIQLAEGEEEIYAKIVFFELILLAVRFRTIPIPTKYLRI